jgi:hypothetical protein
MGPRAPRRSTRPAPSGSAGGRAAAARGSDEAAGAPAGLDRIQSLSPAPPLLLLFCSLRVLAVAALVRCGVVLDERRRCEEVDGARTGGRDGAPALLEEKKKVVTGCTALPTGHARMNGGYRYYSSSPLGWVAVPIPLRAVC